MPNEPATPDPRLRPFESAASLLCEPDPGPTPFLVQELVVAGALVVLAGKWKVGKTYLLLELARAIVTGQPALGHFEIPEAGPVMVVLEESGRAALHRRLDMLARGNAQTPDWFINLHFAANRGVKLDIRAHVDWLLQEAARCKPAAIILDPWARVKGVGDENVKKEIDISVDAMIQLRRETGAAIILAAHQGHTGDHIRGSSDLEAVWESRLSLARDEHSVSTLKAEHREAEAAGPYTYRSVFDNDTRTVRLSVIAEPDAVERDLAAEIKAHLLDNGGDTETEIAKAVKIRRATVEGILRSDPRFELVQTPQGRSARGRFWGLTTDHLPGLGTSTDNSGGGQRGIDPSPASLKGGRDEYEPRPVPDPDMTWR